MRPRSFCLVLLLLCLSALPLCARDFLIRRGGQLQVYVPAFDRPVANTALSMLQEDMQRVLSCTLQKSDSRDNAMIVLGIDSTLQRQGYMLRVEDGRLFVDGADAHGVAYGLMDVSRRLGVSPWEYWADCQPQPLDEFVIKDKTYSGSYPSVEFRGIFINDEDWGLNPWATRIEPEAWTLHQGRIRGAVGPKATEQIFRLLLRLRANYYWPPMHECSQPFFTIEGNRQLAAEYGIYIGGSHCEPMATSPAAEWNLTGDGDYNYVTNADAVRQFWHNRLLEVRDQEIVYTLGMRGVHDGAMQGTKTDSEKLRYLQQVIDDQRSMLREVNPDVTRIPQVFVPYKEVLDIYHSGLKVPDDVTLMWTDDNYGYIRHMPDSVERARSGGNGLYYHVSYWGRPHDYLWLNSFSPDLMVSQLRMAWWQGIRKMWVLNVGDIKPSEYQTDLFMQLAWHGFYSKQSVIMPASDISRRHLHRFVDMHFGVSGGNKAAKKQCEAIAHVLGEYFALSADMKPEFLAGTRVEESDKVYWSQIRPMLGDWNQQRIADRVARYQEISDAAERLYAALPAHCRDAFFQLVKYPVQAAAQMNFKFLVPERSLSAFDSIQSLTFTYNKVCADGKWDGIMNASPRSLPVFSRIDPAVLPTYPASSPWMALSLRYGKGKVRTAATADSIALRVHLEPNHPIVGNRLAFCIEVDGVRSPEYEFQTVGRSEEWKQNVLRGYAERQFTLPLTKRGKTHTIRFIPLTPGVVLREMYVKSESV